MSPGQRAVLDCRVLRLNVLIEDGTVVPTVALGGEVEVLTRVLRERPREALQGLPEARSGGLSGVGRGKQVGVRVRAARVGRVVRACGIGQLNYITIVRNIGWDGGRVAEAGAGGLVDEEQVTGVVPGIGVVVSGSQ